MTAGARYRLLPHTADLRVEVRCPDFPGLCAASVETLFSLLTDRRKVRRAAERTLFSAGATREEQYHGILRNALLLFALDRFLVRSADATMEAGAVTVTVAGETADPARHEAYREIKGVTAHGLAVSAGPSGWTGSFVLDV
jgi:SHS2 domain-containing protein